MAKKPRLGSGGRFKALAKKVGAATAAAIGRSKYGVRKFAKLANAGRKRAAAKRKK
jgi:hypothetical protein